MIKRFLAITLMSLVYMIIRYITIIHFFFISKSVNTERVNEILTDPLWLLISFIPFILLITALVPLEIKYNYKLLPMDNVNRGHWIAGMTIFISIFLITSAIVFQDPGTPKDGRILVDERNSPWETSTLNMDREWYGIGSTYNAYTVIEWLKNSYRVDRIVDLNYDKLNISNVSKVKPDIVADRITPKILDEYDILIVKTPKPYHKEEIEAIENFVNNGGGLLLIGDHSDFSGTSTSLNEIARNFGIRFEFDTVTGAGNDFNTYIREGNLPFIKKGLSHPCLKYTPYFEFMTSCSIFSSPLNEQVMRGGALVKEPGEHVTSNFFKLSRNKDVSHEWDRNFGIFNQAIALKYGKGRIVAFTDSTTISNFRCFFGGTPNLIAGIIEYLNKKNQYQYLIELFLILGLVSAALALYFLKNESRSTVILLIIVIGSMAVSAAVITFAGTVEESIPAKYYDRNHTICFDSEHSANILDTPSLFDYQSYKNVYNVFFIWTQRANITPFIGNLEDCFERGDVIVIIDPVSRLTQSETYSIKQFVKSGGKLLIMLNDTREPSKNLATEFKLDLENIEAIYPASRNSVNKTLPIEPWGISIIGGKPLKKIGNRTILAQLRLGKGMVIAFTPSYVFRDGINGNPGYMGSIASIPNKSNLPYDLKELYDLEYYILDLCLLNSNRSRSLPILDS
jgi:flavodoxin